MIVGRTLEEFAEPGQQRSCEVKGMQLLQRVCEEEDQKEDWMGRKEIEMGN